MINLLQQYSLSNIIIFIIVLALAIKGLVSFIDWAHARVKKVFDKEHGKLSEKEQLERRLRQGS